MKKVSGQKKLMENKTKSKIPKTSGEKEKWIRARQIVTKESGAKSEKAVPWGLVNHIYENEKKANKTIKPAEVKKEKLSKAVKSYKRSK